MTPSEIRAKEAKELKKILEEKRTEWFSLQLKKSSGQLAKHHEIRETRKDIARIQTVLREKSFDAAQDKKGSR